MHASHTDTYNSQGWQSGSNIRTIRTLTLQLYLRTTWVNQTPPTQCALSSSLIHSADDPLEQYHIINCSSQHGLLLYLLTTPATLCWGWHAAPTYTYVPLNVCHAFPEVAEWLQHTYEAPTSRTVCMSPEGIEGLFPLMSLQLECHASKKSGVLTMIYGILVKYMDMD